MSPILNGAAMARSLKDCLERILEKMPLPEAMVSRGDLGGGAAGLAVAFAHLHHRQPNRGFRERAIGYLQVARRCLEDVPMGPGLLGGVAGIAWAHGQVMAALGEPPDQDPCLPLDEVLEEHVRRTRGGPLDLGAGLAGIGVHALARARAGRGSALLEAVLEALRVRALPLDEQGPWQTPPEELPDYLRELAPLGCTNLGLAHGLPGILGLLGKAVSGGWGGPGLGKVLEQSLAWTLDQRHPEEAPSCFGYWIPRGETSAQRRERLLTPSRIAWCYGDLGAGVGLLQATLGTADPALGAAALRICRKAAARPVEASGVVDAGLCHGAAGNVHLFHRLHWATGEPPFLEAARTWLVKVLALEQEHGGFFTWQPGAGDEAGVWHDQRGLLVGQAGIALVLDGCLGGLQGTWDEFLMTDLPTWI